MPMALCIENHVGGVGETKRFRIQWRIVTVERKWPL